MPETKLEAVKKQFSKAVKQLGRVLEEEKNEIVRDSAIKRFEFTFDLSWKLLKAYLDEEKGIYCASPKECFRQAFQSGIVDYNEVWIEMTDQRNYAVHIYEEKFADELFKKLPKYLECFQELQKIFN